MRYARIVSATEPRRTRNGRPKMSRWISSLSLLLGLAVAAAAFAESLYRWVDDEGKVHFTTTLPPEAADRPYDLYSANGILIEKVADPREKRRKEREEAEAAGSSKPKPLYTEEQKKSIGDRLLLLKYRSEEDLTEAMNLEIDHLKYDTRILEATQQSLMNSLSGQITIAAARQRSGMPIEDQQRKEIDVLRRRLRDNQVEMERMAERKSKIRSDFDADVQEESAGD